MVALRLHKNKGKGGEREGGEGETTMWSSAPDMHFGPHQPMQTMCVFVCVFKVQACMCI